MALVVGSFGPMIASACCIAEAPFSIRRWFQSSRSGLATANLVQTPQRLASCSFRNGLKLFEMIANNSTSVIIDNDMVQVTRKDEKEANENIIRRFNRRVLQSGALAKAKASMRFEKPISKTERRKKAIIRKERKAEKTAKMRLGIR